MTERLREVSEVAKLLHVGKIDPPERVNEQDEIRQV